jgi:hypothetical protein
LLCHPPPSRSEVHAHTLPTIIKRGGGGRGDIHKRKDIIKKRMRKIDIP